MAERRYAAVFYTAVLVALAATYGVYRMLEKTKESSQLVTAPVVIAAQDLPEGSRISEAVESMEEHWDRRATERNWATLDVVGRISEETGKSYAQISLNWLLRQDGVTAPIIGARTLEQLDDNIGASSWELTSEQVGDLSEAGALEDVYPYRFIRNAQRV